MSNLCINWRFGGLFVQLNRWHDWWLWMRGRTIGRPWRVERVPGRPAQGEAWMAFYQGRAYAALLLLALVLAVLAVAS